MAKLLVGGIRYKPKPKTTLPILFDLEKAVFCIKPLGRRLYLTRTLYDSCLTWLWATTPTFLHFNLNEKIQELTPGYGHQSLVPRLYKARAEDIKRMVDGGVWCGG